MPPLTDTVKLFGRRSTKGDDSSDASLKTGGSIVANEAMISVTIGEVGVRIRDGEKALDLPDRNKGNTGALTISPFKARLLALSGITAPESSKRP